MPEQQPTPKPTAEQYQKLRYSEAPSFTGIDVFAISADGENNWTAMSLTADRARRLVACWNACIGIPTEALEAGSLVDVLKVVRPWIEDPDLTWGTPVRDDAVRKIDALLRAK